MPSRAFLRATSTVDLSPYATTTAVNAAVSAQALAPVLHKVRQTVAYGPVTAAGLPDFLPATSASLSLSTQNLAVAALVVVAARGKDTRVGSSSVDLTWAGLAASSTNYLYIQVAPDGTLTTGSATIAPAYQNGGTPSVTNNAHTFNITQMVCYVGNGSAANGAYRVFVGEAVTNGATVTATVAYAYQGRYTSAWTAFAVATTYTHNHNIGVLPRLVEGYLSNKADGVCTAASDIFFPMATTGYAASNAAGSKSFWLDRNVLKMRAVSNGIYATGTDGTTTFASDNGIYAQFVVERGW